MAGSMRNKTLPYVVLLGDVGTGKSTLFEKLTGVTERSSEASTSVTVVSEVLPLPDGSMSICDTPGSNAMADKFQHNLWIAEAINYHPVSRILIMVKADTRIDNVVDDVRKYAEGFLDLPRMEDVMAVCVTHMDTVKWKKKEFTRHLESELGINAVIFSGKETPAPTIQRDLQQICKYSFELNVNEDNFLKLFKINNNNVKILRSTKREVADIQSLYAKFKEERKRFDTTKDQTDLIFEFQAWIEDLVIKAKQRVSEENKFTFAGESMANEVGHIANMTNQLRNVLFEVRTEVLGSQSSHGVSQLRRCPHCNLVWAKVAGCDGQTTCGARESGFDVRSPDFGVLGTFKFDWDGKSLKITKVGEREVTEQQERNERSGVGCGKSIKWTDMVPVEVPPEFCELQIVTTDDVKLVPEEAEKTWSAQYKEATRWMRTKIADPNFEIPVVPEEAKKTWWEYFIEIASWLKTKIVG